MQSTVDEIKRKLDIVQVVGSYVKLQKVGVNYRASSPFNAEKTPSFYVSPVKQIWHDFSSGRGGDMFTFVMEIENVDFYEALKTLAKKAGVELKADPQFSKERGAKDRQYELCDLACRFFEKQLSASSAGKVAFDYLISRGLSQESIAQWRLGYAPDSWDSLSKFLFSRKFSYAEIEKVGLAIFKQGGAVYDRFRERIMYPIFDATGRVSGFTGRVLSKKQEEQGMAKYMNTPNTLIYDKSQALYGINFAKMDVIKQNECLVVEGQMDVLMSHQAGVKNVIATSGTALTQFHLAIIKRFTNNLILAFDMDLGGNSATDRAIKLALSQGFNISTITMGQGQDPADVVKENAAKWQEMSKEKKTIEDFYFEVAFSRFDKDSIEGKKSIGAMVLPVIKNVANKIEQDHYLDKLSAMLCVRAETLREEMNSIKEQILPAERVEQKSVETAKVFVPVAKTRKDMLEERIVALAISNPELKSQLDNDDLIMFSEKLKSVMDLYKQSDKFETSLISDQLVKSYLDDLLFQSEVFGSHDFEKIEAKHEFAESLKEFRILGVKEKMSNLQLRIKNAEICKNSDDANTLCKEFQTLSEKLTKYI